MGFAGALAPGTTNSRGISPDLEDTQEFLDALISRKRKGRNLKLSEMDVTKVVNTVIDDFNQGVASNRTFLEAHRQYIRNWRMVPEDKTDHPWGKLAANVKVPITSNFIEQWMARLSKLILDNTPIAPVSSLNLAVQRDMRDVSDWFDTELRNIVGIEDSLDDIFRHVLIDGLSLPIPIYEKIKKNFFESKEFDIDTAQPIKPQIYLAIEQLFQDEEVEGVEETAQPGVYAVSFPYEDSIGEIRALIENGMLILEVERVKCTFDGVRILCPSIAEDTVVINSDPDIEKLPFFGTRIWLSAGEVLQKYKNEFSRLTEVELNRVLASKGPKQPQFIPNEITLEHDEIEGTDSTANHTSNTDDDREWVEVYRWESNITYKGDRIPVIAWVAAASATLLKIDRLEEINPEGCRTAVKIDFIRVPGRFYSIGLAEWLRHVQTEMDGIHNFRLDSALIATSPFGFYEPNSGNSNDILSIKPGELRPIRSVKGLLFPTMNWNSIWGFQEEGLVRKYASELAGIGDPGTGSFTSKRVSASEFTGTLAAIDVRTEYIARRVLSGVRKLFERIFVLYQKHAQTGRVYQVVGEKGEQIVKRLDRSKLFGKMQITLAANIQQLSSQVEKETSMMMFQLLTNQFLVGMGIVKPDTIYEAVKKILKTSNYSGVPLHKPDIMEDSPSPSEEHQAMMIGQMVEPHVGENFAEHLQAHLKLASNPLLNKMLPSPLSQKLLAEHIAMTSQMQQQVVAMRQIQAAQANAMAGQLAQFGLNQPGSGAEPGTKEEGVQTAPSGNANAGY